MCSELMARVGQVTGTVWRHWERIIRNRLRYTTSEDAKRKGALI